MVVHEVRIVLENDHEVDRGEENLNALQQGANGRAIAKVEFALGRVAGSGRERQNRLVQFGQQSGRPCFDLHFVDIS